MENITESMDMTQVVYSDIKEFLNSAGDLMVDGASMGWDLIVNKMFWVDGVISFILGIVFLIVAYISYRKLKSFLDKFDQVEEAYVFSCVFGIIGILILIGLGMLNVYGGAIHMVIPEYYAVEKLIRFVK